MTEHPDDHRPASRWRQVADPDERTRMHVIIEFVAPGDRVPRHVHHVDEVVLVEAGRGLVHVDGCETSVAAGDVVFVPAGAVHGLRNVGDTDLSIRAVYPTDSVDITFIERNPRA